jgi:ribosomal peptide maturation radical SAM protein 1
MRPTANRVLMVQMPLATPEFPGIGPALLRSVLIRDGISCDIKYANLDFSRIIGGDPFVEKQLSKLAISEIIFTPYYFGGSASETADYLSQYLEGVMSGVGFDRSYRVRALMEAAGTLLDTVMAGIDWTKYAVVAFSTMMQQTVASLALAKRIRRDYPDIRIVFGGPNTSKPMGDEMILRFPEIDVIAQGEADAIITPLMRELLDGVQTDFRTPGVLYRAANGDIVKSGPDKAFEDMDSSPIPDFGPFFEQLEANGLSHVQPYLTIETSRGCWWGQKHHCTFCGIDDDVMAFRTKSETRVIEEILTLSARHRVTDFFVVDSIINTRFLKTLLPRIGQLRENPGFDFAFFFESKSNLRRDQIRVMRYGGVNSVQPGIESFDDEILTMMDKGSTSARQIQCLKLLAEAGIIANWNLLFRLPLESEESYRRMIDLVPCLHHLPPLHGEGMIPMLLNRFAPYHNTPEQFQISNIRALPWYEKVFPQEDIDLTRLAFYFEYDCPTFENETLLALHRELAEAIRLWQESWVDGTLIQKRGPGFVAIEDRRILPDGGGGLAPPRNSHTILRGVQAEIFSACDEVTTVASLKRRFADRMNAEEIDLFLRFLTEERLIFCVEEGQVVNLPLLPEVRLPLPVQMNTPAEQRISPASLTVLATPASGARVSGQ